MTMVELIVVVAIIVILAALMLPMIGGIREHARRATCVSNLHQLQVAAMSYANDNGGQLPRSATEQVVEVYAGETGGATYEDVGVLRGWLHWFNDVSDKKTYWWGTNAIACITNGTLFPYVGDAGDEKIYVCPSFVRYVRDHATLPATVKRMPVRSYGMNPECSGRTFYRLAGPTRVMLFAEQGLWRNPTPGGPYNYGLEDWAAVWDDPPPDPVAGRYTRRYFRNLDGCIDYRYGAVVTREHLGSYHSERGEKGHCVFLDGHVELVKWTNTMQVCTGDWGE
jgi:prepilin-type processing-associated H-X9-DG protein